MNEIICPKCSTAFTIDEAGYADILKQVRDRQFEEELSKRLDLAEKEKQHAVQLAQAELQNKLQAQLSAKDQELAELKNKNAQALSASLNQKDTEIQQLRSKMEQAEVEKKLAISLAIQQSEKERDELANQLKIKDAETLLLEKSLSEKYVAELKEKDAIIRHKDEEIALRKDMKVRLSTKMIGETLEQHCETEFNKLRATAFQKAYFERIMIPDPAAKVTIFIKKKMSQAMKLSPSCLK